MSAFIIFALMTLSAMFMVLLPLGWRRHGTVVTDVDVYRAQLAEVERARVVGIVPADESEGLRTEIARRLIAAADRLRPAAGDAVWRRRATAVATIILVPAIAAAVYLSYGNPQMLDRPIAGRVNTGAGDDTLALISRVEGVLKERPEDGRGWDLLAPVYLRVGRAQDAVGAYANAIRILGSTPEREAGHGEALTIAANGAVTAEARKAFTRAIEANPNDARASYFLARAKAQGGDRAGAVEDMKALLSRAPRDAPWRGFVERALAEFERAAP